MKTSIPGLFFIGFILTITACSEDESFNFGNCRIEQVEWTGAITRTDSYLYNQNGKKVKWERITEGDEPYAEEYEYTDGRISKIIRPTTVLDIAYKSGKVFKIIESDLDGFHISTHDYVWDGNVLTITKTSGLSSYSTETYTFDGKDIIKFEGRSYQGESLVYYDLTVFSEFDEAYNPEYLMDLPFPASLHNYNKISVTITDYDGNGGVINQDGLNYFYEITTNKSGAVSTRIRTNAKTGAVVNRVYTYENCQ